MNKALIAPSMMCVPAWRGTEEALDALERGGVDLLHLDIMDGQFVPNMMLGTEHVKQLREANPSEDFYPLNTIMGENWDLQPWMASQGLKGGVVVDEADGKTYVPYATDAAAPVWDWFKKLYDEKLLDPASFVDKTKDMRNKMGAASQQTAVDVDWAAWVGLHNANAAAGGVSVEDFEIVSLPGCKTPDGSYMLHKGNASLFAVPINAKNVEGAVKVLEYFATRRAAEPGHQGSRLHRGRQRQLRADRDRREPRDGPRRADPDRQGFRQSHRSEPGR